MELGGLLMGCALLSGRGAFNGLWSLGFDPFSAAIQTGDFFLKLYFIEV